MITGLDKLGAEEGIQPWKPGDPTSTLVWGSEGVGKSAFWMTAPGPIIVLDFEHNLHETMVGMQSIAGSKEIHRLPYLVPSLGDTQAAKAVGDKIVSDITAVCDLLSRQKIKATIVFDSITKMWEIFRFGFVSLDEKGRARPREYGLAVAKVNGLIQRIKSFGHSIIFVARAKPLWKDDKDMGVNVGDYYKDFGYASNSIVEISKDDGSRVYKIHRCKTREGLEGMTLDSEDGFDYNKLMELIKP